MIALKHNLPFWLSGPEAARFAGAAQAFWERLEAWLTGVAPQADIRLCFLAAPRFRRVDTESAGAAAAHSATSAGNGPMKRLHP